VTQPESRSPQAAWSVWNPAIPLLLLSVLDSAGSLSPKPTAPIKSRTSTVQHTGLFSFPQTAKQVGLYQKLGYWPQYLTAIMMRSPDANKTPKANSSNEPVLLSTFKKREREQTIAACKRLTGRIKNGLESPVPIG
jgi:hypothetical protein